MLPVEPHGLIYEVYVPVLPKIIKLIPKPILFPVCLIKDYSWKLCGRNENFISRYIFKGIDTLYVVKWNTTGVTLEITYMMWLLP